MAGSPPASVEARARALDVACAQQRAICSASSL